MNGNANRQTEIEISSEVCGLLVHINKILEKKAIMVESEHYNDINNCQLSVRALPNNSCYKSSLFLRDRYAVLRTFEYFAIKAINQICIFPCAALLIFWSSAPQTGMSFYSLNHLPFLPRTLYVSTLFFGRKGESLVAVPIRITYYIIL